MQENILKCYKLILGSIATFILLTGCNSGTTGSTNSLTSQNNVQSKIAMNNSLGTNAIIAKIQKLKGSSTIGINYTLDGEPLNTQTDNWNDMGWHLLTLTVSSAAPNQAPIPVQGVWATVGSPQNPVIDGETVTVQDINCNSAVFSQVNQTCSAYVKVSYNYTTYPNANPIITVNFAPNNFDNLPIMIQPHDWIKSQTVGIYRPIQTIESQYYAGSSVKVNPGQYKMLLMQNGNLESLTINNLTAPTNPNFTLLHRTTSSTNDPIYGSWNECSLTANTGLNQVATLPSLNSSCILVYQAAATSISTSQTANLTVGTSASDTFPYNATSYTLTASYSGSAFSGVNWNPYSLTVHSWNAIAYGNGTFVALSTGGSVAYSTDGVHWNYTTLQSLPSTANWQTLTFGNGKFVAISNNARLTAYSSDGIHWNYGVLPLLQTWNGIAYGGGKFVAIEDNYSDYANGPTAAYSNDGINWNQSNMPSNQVWWAVTYGNNKFVAVSYSSNSAAYSIDGVNWTPSTLPASSQEWGSIAYGNGVFVTIVNTMSNGSNIFAYSTDGINWTQGTMPSSQIWQAVTYGNGIFIAIASNSNIAAYSFDGINWHQITLPTSTNWQSIIFGNNEFVATDAYNNVTDGIISMSPNTLNNFTMQSN